MKDYEISKIFISESLITISLQPYHQHVNSHAALRMHSPTHSRAEGRHRWFSDVSRLQHGRYRSYTQIP